MGTIFQQYYTKSNEIISYMIQKLEIKPESSVLEPCAGDGAFIDALLGLNLNIEIDAFELDPKAVAFLEKKYKDITNLKILNTDTLLYKPFIDGSNRIKYDYIIANPPYGAWQDYEKREGLKSIYPNLYVKETYSTFLYLCLSLLNENGKLVFITPDTYLYLHRHTFLRKYLLNNSMIEEISIFPSSFFPGVNFGYSKLSIITLTKSRNTNDILENEIIIKETFQKPSDLLIHDSIRLPQKLIKQKKILNNIDHAFFLSDNTPLNNLLNFSKLKIGDIAHCVTGIYTGNDKEYIKVRDTSIKNGKNYQEIIDDEIYENIRPPSIFGLSNGRTYIPLIKGGNTRYYKSNLWFINWSVEAVSNYKTNKKARFQNPQFYFKTGIGVPMVSSNNVTASLIDNRLFDQSIVGIFPKDKNNLLYLLAFFNSSICTKLLRLINPSANNSANYIKKVPVIIPDKQTLSHINELVKSLLDLLRTNKNIDFEKSELDDIFNVIYLENVEINTDVVQQELFVL
jgi:phospholipid N-methyltransferase